MGIVTSAAPAASSRRPYLVHPRFDGLLVGWLGAGLWCLMWVAQAGGVDVAAHSGGLVLVASVLLAAHFMMSYRLAYVGGMGRARAHPVSLIAVPILLALAAGVVAAVALSRGVQAVGGVTSVLLTAVYVTSGFHFVRQSYGVTRIGIRYAGVSLTARESAVLRWGAYPIWLAGLTPLLGGASASYVGFPVFSVPLDGAVHVALKGMAVAAIAAIAGVYLGVHRRGQPVTSVMTAPYVAVSVWMFAPIGGVAAASVAFTLSHAVQYLACCYRVERHRPGGEGGAGLAKWFYVLAVAAAGGVLITRGLPQWANAAILDPGSPLLFSALAFWVLNLNHYVTDAVIWRSSGRLLAPREAPATLLRGSDRVRSGIVTR